MSETDGHPGVAVLRTRSAGGLDGPFPPAFRVADGAEGVGQVTGPPVQLLGEARVVVGKSEERGVKTLKLPRSAHTWGRVSHVLHGIPGWRTSDGQLQRGVHDSRFQGLNRRDPKATSDSDLGAAFRRRGERAPKGPSSPLGHGHLLAVALEGSQELGATLRPREGA